jgi:hypothetical protein
LIFVIEEALGTEVGGAGVGVLILEFGDVGGKPAECEWIGAGLGADRSEASNNSRY